MRVSIIVPTCQGHPNDTLSPKANPSIVYSLDETVSTESGSMSEVYTTEDSRDEKDFDDYYYDTDITTSSDDDDESESDHSRENHNSDSSHSRDHNSHSRGKGLIARLREKNRSAHSKEQYRHSPHVVSETGNSTHSKEKSQSAHWREKIMSPIAKASPEKDPLSSDARYIALVVGKTPNMSNKTLIVEPLQQQRTFPSQASVSTENSSSAGVRLSSHDRSQGKSVSSEEMYQRLVVGAPPVAKGTFEKQQTASLHSGSFQSTESNTSRHVVYQASSGNTNWESSLSPNMEEDDEEENEGESHVLGEIKNGATPKAHAVSLAKKETENVTTPKAHAVSPAKKETENATTPKSHAVSPAKKEIENITMPKANAVLPVKKETEDVAAPKAQTVSPVKEIENVAAQKTLAVLPAKKESVDAAMESKTQAPSMKSLVPVAGPNKAKKTVTNITCAAEGMEKDLSSMIESLGIILLGCGSRQDVDENQEEEIVPDEDLPMTRLFADLRKQRLRNQFLLHERNTVAEENKKLRAELKERENEVQNLGLKVKQLEEEKEQAIEHTRLRDAKLGEIVNDLL